MKRTTAQNDAAFAIQKFVSRGDTLFTVLRSVSRSGMSRTIDLYVIKDNEPFYLSGFAATLQGRRRAKDGSVIMQGCGMDMGFELVYSLSMALYCPEKYDHYAAYALNHRWL